MQGPTGTPAKAQGLSVQLIPVDPTAQEIKRAIFLFPQIAGENSRQNLLCWLNISNIFEYLQCSPTCQAFVKFLVNQLTTKPDVGFVGHVRDIWTPRKADVYPWQCAPRWRDVSLQDGGDCIKLLPQHLLLMGMISAHRFLWGQRSSICRLLGWQGMFCKLMAQPLLLGGDKPQGTACSLIQHCPCGNSRSSKMLPLWVHPEG